MNRKRLVVGLILLLIGISVIPITAQDTEKLSQPTSRGNWLYVGGSGPGNYTRIQDAINNASNGDTVFVFNGTYYEHIVINKAIYLIGKNVNTTTIIDNFSGNSHAMLIQHDNVTIKGFTIKGEMTYDAIGLGSDYITIEGNRISSGVGIYVGSSYNSILYNNITGYGLPGSLQGCGIYIDSIFSYNIIEHNSIFSGNGISMPGNHNFINNNLIVQYDSTILYGGSLNVISNNTFRGSGLQFYMVPGYDIVSNNTVNGKPLVFLDNTSNRVIDYDTGQVILVRCDNITVANQNFSYSPYSIQVLSSTHCHIVNNTISHCYGAFGSGAGIAIYNSDTIMVMDNTLNSSAIQIGQYDFGYNNNIIISRNTFTAERNQMANSIMITNSNNITISYNNLFNTFIDLHYFCYNCNICCNNYFTDIVDYKLAGIQVFVPLGSHNTFYHNYWWRPRLAPKPIFGTLYKGAEWPWDLLLPWLFIDWHPALKPYDIPGMR